jgi:hypothetical protein
MARSAQANLRRVIPLACADGRHDRAQRRRSLDKAGPLLFLPVGPGSSGEALRYTELNPARAGRQRECSLRRIPIRGPAPLFIAGRGHQTYRWIRDFGSNPGQPVIGAAISRREPRQPRPFARAPIPDGRSAQRNSSKGWNAALAAPWLLRKAGARAKLPATHGNELSNFSGKVPSVPGFRPGISERRTRAA